MSEKQVIQETEQGYLVGGEIYKNLKEAIEACDHNYVFIPYRKTNTAFPIFNGK